ncbi:SUKH-4 family immunity protein [Hazenella coriacea]|uniref:SUKH-4 immunity protein of toxin-antitoxin system n=1 Tax=Hazenella coriacea TaxID=1179467 RepID=A0A4R3L2W5_9BACL|nr:SUKH-4 family immunity protein [Hazenella coriacea]TCS93245.1 SUKH-4 immunity protein of toxin-antitoxin system [Hazenella coriacea]
MDKTLKEITGFWGESLEKIHHKTIDKFPLSEETKLFLTSIGLPVQDDFFISFYGNDQILELAYESKQIVSIGDDFGTKICIEPDSDQIISIDEQAEYPTRFVNSSITNLLQFMMIYKKKLPALKDATDEEACKIVDQINKEYKRIDSKAIENEENWWSIILEQTELGLI